MRSSLKSKDKFSFVFIVSSIVHKKGYLYIYIFMYIMWLWFTKMCFYIVYIIYHVYAESFFWRNNSTRNKWRREKICVQVNVTNGRKFHTIERLLRKFKVQYISNDTKTCRYKTHITKNFYKWFIIHTTWSY